ncbi:MAG: ATP-binding protein [Deltaproteobacteria bacterium]|nr:ATP-binding protein [Deltaproteobacteria bacterium]MBI3295914.1 ATP-binding protein [Deltaproteobacteria bacterium]
MSISNNSYYDRELDLSRFKTSCFILGPRMTGKTSLLKNIRSQYNLNLLIPENELKYGKDPKQFWQEIAVLKPGDTAIVDEIQRVPALLDYVQMGIEDKKIRFLLSGSSARKLKRGHANLLGGRALDLKLHPLTRKELGSHFSIQVACSLGTLPKVVSLIDEGNVDEAKLVLRSYLTTYIKEEIQAEALVRQLDAFQRFLDVAGQSHAQMIEFDNIARECQVPSSTVKQYYQILEDTLMGFFLWPWNRSERKKARPKFYFFDCGVVRAIQEKVTSRPGSDELGFLFESWFINEMLSIRDYGFKEERFSLWREGKWEVDLIVERGKQMCLAVECKSGKQLGNIHSIRAFKERFPKVRVLIASLQDERKSKVENGIEIWPYGDVLDFYRGL